jgi:HMG-box domain
MMTSKECNNRRKVSFESTQTVSPTALDVESNDHAEEKPVRPLSAYNLFFRLERDRLLSLTCNSQIAPQDLVITAHDVASISVLRRYARGEKRQHRKTHGRMGFSELTRIISSKWKIIPADTKQLFEERAIQEKRKYNKQMKLWKGTLKNTKNENNGKVNLLVDTTCVQPKKGAPFLNDKVTICEHHPNKPWIKQQASSPSHNKIHDINISDCLTYRQHDDTCDWSSQIPHQALEDEVDYSDDVLDYLNEFGRSSRATFPESAYAAQSLRLQNTNRMRAGDLFTFSQPNPINTASFVASHDIPIGYLNKSARNYEMSSAVLRSVEKCNRAYREVELFLNSSEDSFGPPSDIIPAENVFDDYYDFDLSF